MTQARIRELELALANAEARLEGMVEIAADAFISMDASQNITYFNQGAERTFEWSRHEVIGRPLDILIPEALRAVHRQHVARFGASQANSRQMGHRLPITGLRRSGEVFPAEASISKFTVDGETRFHVVLRDVTEQRRAEEQQRFLAEAGELLTTSLDAMETYSRAARAVVPRLSDACVIWMLDDDRNELRAVAAYGRETVPGAGSLLVRLQETPIPMTSSHAAATVIRSGQRASFVVGSSQSAPHELNVASLLHGAASGYARPALGEPGAADVQGLLVPISAAGDTRGVLALYRSTRPFTPDSIVIAEDFARRLALASANALLYERAQRAIRARDETMAVVSHDLRNPVSAIRMIAGALLDRGEREDTRLPEVRDELSTIATGARQAEALIQDLLDAARIEAGTLAVSLERVNLGQLLQESCELLRPLARERGLTLELRAPEGSGNDALPPVEADWERLQQVISNLVGNSLRFTPEGGRITLSALAEGGVVRVVVEDTGVGIAPEALPHVFDRYWQGSSRKGRGAGLGLTIAQGIAHAHGGRITVESEQRVRTVFTVELPVG